MTLTDRQIGLVRDSFDRIRFDLTPPSDLFYRLLFERAPELRGLFRDDLEGQGMKFMSTLAAVVDNLHDPSALDRRYTELGQGHQRLRIEAAHFDTMEEALIDTLRASLGDGFDADTEAAWRAAYRQLAAEMIERGGIA